MVRKKINQLAPGKKRKREDRDIKNAFLDGMTVALDLTHKEELRIMKEIGYMGSLQVEEPK